MNKAAVHGYLGRIGMEHVDCAAADADTLSALHFQHQVAVPFENLSIHLDQDIVLDEDALLDKIVTDRRGGFCYELNGVFAALLRSLGYRVSLLGARVFGDDGLPGFPYNHLALEVTCADGAAYLVDVGFGRHSHYPLRLDERGDQSDPGGVFQLVHTPEGDIDVYRDGRPQYRLELRPRELRDFEAGCWYNSTSPHAPFTQSLICSRLLENGGRLTLSGRQLITTGPDGAKDEVELAADEVLSSYRGHFALELAREPVVRAS